MVAKDKVCNLIFIFKFFSYAFRLRIYKKSQSVIIVALFYGTIHAADAEHELTCADLGITRLLEHGQEFLGQRELED